MQVIIFEDEYCKQQYPINLTKPCSRVLIAGTCLEDMIKRTFSEPDYLGRNYLFNTPQLEDDALFINSCLVPDIKKKDELKDIVMKNKRFMIKKKERILVNRGELGKGREINYDLDIINYPWDPIIYNKELLNDNLEEFIKDKESEFEEREKNVFVGKNVKINKGAELNTDHGIIIIGDNTKINNFVSIHGPCYIGKNCQIKEFTVLEHSSIGDVCKIRGEVETSIFNSYTNKQHYGFIGHALIGSWVNLGAGTVNSDLKNTYGNINVELMEKKIDTGQQFLGCVIGDYSKTAIGTKIYTGKIIGVNSFIYSTVKENVPSFVNYSKKVSEFHLNKAIEVQKRIFSRRNIEQTPKDIEILKKVFELTKKERKKH